ncbi:MAG TPA: efflux RND transporter periplasmic adaptor subunit [Vicinamibacterales bacterium]|nr:efflux RND transporter periplasmic adaptor subunit [Vicinamibacterales bacterium]
MSNRRSRGPLVGAALLIVAAIAVAFWGISTRARALSVVTTETRELAVPIVAVITAEKGAPQQDIVLPGTMQAFTDAAIYARTNGYLRKWYADIGSRVRTGQVLADIDSPEVEQQLEQARADLATADANARLAQSTAERYRDLIKTDSVSKQDLDNANGSLEAKLTAVNSAKANVRRLEQLHGFGQVTAPFDGVVTARNTDVGALIDSGSNAKELFHVAAVHRLRVFVNVPEIYSRAAQTGMKADLTLAEFPGRAFTGTLARTAQSIDTASRTLLTEIDVENAKGELLPGSYAEVHLKLPGAQSTYKLPVNAIIFRTEGVRVAVVGEDGKVILQPVTIGRDYGDSLEVVSGLSGRERIIVNAPDSIEAGQAVRVAEKKAE